MVETSEVGFGEELRRQRLAREVTLESIAAATKISVRYLQAIEKGDLEKLPAPVFMRGFLRSYATCVGLDPDEVVNAYLSEAAATPALDDADIAPARGQRLTAAQLSVLVVAAVVVLLLAFGLWRTVGRKRPSPRSAAAARVPVTPPHVRLVPDAVSAPPPAPVSSSIPSGPLELVLTFQADCWSELFADDRLVFSGLLHRGEERRFTASRAFRLTFGNAGVVRVRVNGRELPPIGAAGAVVRDFVVDRQHPQGVAGRRE